MEFFRKANTSARPCHRYPGLTCTKPWYLPLVYGVMIPWIIIGVVTATLSIILCIDWSCGKNPKIEEESIEKENLNPPRLPEKPKPSGESAVSAHQKPILGPGNQFKMDMSNIQGKF